MKGPIYFEGKSLKDLFKEFKLVDTKYKHQRIDSLGDNVNVRTYCNIMGDGITDFLSGSLTPKGMLYNWLRTNTIRTDGGLYWEMVIRDDHSVLITVKYSDLIGSRWLTIVG